MFVIKFNLLNLEKKVSILDCSQLLSFPTIDSLNCKFYEKLVKSVIQRAYYKNSQKISCSLIIKISNYHISSNKTLPRIIPSILIIPAIMIIVILTFMFFLMIPSVQEEHK